MNLSIAGTLVCAVLGGWIETADVAGRWDGSALTLTLKAAGTGVLDGEGDEQVAVTWKLEPGGALALSMPEENLLCIFSTGRDTIRCRPRVGPRRPFLLKRNGPVRPLPPPAPPQPCSIHAVEGVSAGPVRLGMKASELAKLGLKPGPTVEWRVKPNYRVQVNPATGRVVWVRVEGPVCLDTDPKNSGSCGVGALRLGTNLADCPERGYRQVLWDRGPGGWIEIFAPVKAGAPKPECLHTVVPGQSAGGVKLGMSEDALARLGLGFWSDSTFPFKTFGPFMVTFDSKRRVTGIDLGVKERPCLDSQAITADWRREDLCTHGFCGCSAIQDAMAQGITRAYCPQGIRFNFDTTAPGKLFGLRVEAATAAPDAGAGK